MRSRSVLFLLGAAILAAASLTLLYRGTRLLSTGPETPRKVIVIFKTVNYGTFPFWSNVRDGVVSAGKDFAVDVSIRGPILESDIQLKGMLPLENFKKCIGKIEDMQQRLGLGGPNQ